VNKSLGLARLYERAHRLLALKALRECVATFRPRDGIPAVQYYEKKYKELMLALSLPYHAMLFVDRNLCSHMPAAPVHAGRVHPTIPSLKPEAGKKRQRPERRPA